MGTVCRPMKAVQPGEIPDIVARQYPPLTPGFLKEQMIWKVSKGAMGLLESGNIKALLAQGSCNGGGKMVVKQEPYQASGELQM